MRRTVDHDYLQDFACGHVTAVADPASFAKVVETVKAA
jgi:hypothetical protein